MDPETVIRQSPRAVFRKLENEAGGVLLHLDSTAYHGLNEMGTMIWLLIVEGVSFAELLQHLRTSIEDAPPSLADDVAEFLHALDHRELVVLEGANASPTARQDRS